MVPTLLEQQRLGAGGVQHVAALTKHNQRCSCTNGVGSLYRRPKARSRFQHITAAAPRSPRGPNQSGSLIMPGGSGPEIGADGFPTNWKQGPSRLILPPEYAAGAKQSNGSGNGVRKPGGDSIVQQRQQQQAGTTLGATNVSNSNSYRPPPGFMDEDAFASLEQQAANAVMDSQKMLDSLRARAGAWHVLAQYIPTLYSRGFTAATVEAAVDLNPATQDRWITSSTVHASLVRSGQLSEETLAEFDKNGEDQLYPFRFLPVHNRVAAAQYIVDHGLNPQECQILAKSMKEYERRSRERECFTDQPGDCLAFKFYRDAVECRRQEDVDTYLRRALKVTVSQAAKSKLERMLKKSKEPSSSGLEPRLSVLRLDADELTTRPVPITSALREVTMDDLAKLPRCHQSGPFAAFTIDGDARNVQFVSLPQWRILSLSRRPVIIPIEDCGTEPTILKAVGITTKDDKERFSTPGLLCVELEHQSRSVEKKSYYIVSKTSANGSKPTLDLVPGTEVVAASDIVALVLFLCRPPLRDQVVTPASELLKI